MRPDRPRLLLVEDDEPTLELFATVLREEFAVWVARNGTDAMEVSEELGWDADVLVVDLGLGEGPRGDQFVAYYRTRARRPASVILVSGAEGATAIARKLRVATLLPKPVDLNALLRAVRAFASRPQHGNDAAI